MTRAEARRASLVPLWLACLSVGACCSGWSESDDLDEDFEAACFPCDWQHHGPVSRAGTFHPGEHVARMGPGAVLTRTFRAMGHAELDFMVRCDRDATLTAFHETPIHVCTAPEATAGDERLGRRAPQSAAEQVVKGPGVEDVPVHEQEWTRVHRGLGLVVGGGTTTDDVTLTFLRDKGAGSCDIDQVRYRTSSSDCDGCGVF